MSLFKKEKHPQIEEENLSLGKQFLVFGWEIFKVVVISLAIIIPVRYFLIKPFYVKGASMEPNFEDYEYLIIDEISYRFNEPRRGDVVVFKYPGDQSQYFIKRVIGLPGETIIIKDGDVFVIEAGQDETKLLSEDYLSPGTKTTGQVNVTLAQNEYYLLGDNRTASLDSRMFGPVDENLVVGRVLLRGWPVTKAGFLLNKVDYNL